MAARSRSENMLVTKVTRGDAGEVSARKPDDLIVEEPMTIQLDGTKVSTTMRTPGHDYELAVGFCFTDGLLGGAKVTGVRYCANGSARPWPCTRLVGPGSCWPGSCVAIA